MPDLQVTRSSVTVRCTCGDEIEFDDIHDGWQHIYSCDCGKYVSVQFDDPIVQFDAPRFAREVTA